MIFKQIFINNDATNSKNIPHQKKDIEILKDISNALGTYASTAFNNKSKTIKNKKAAEMLSIIKNIENNTKNLDDTELYYYIAIAYRNYSAWFVRGNDRKKILEKCIYNLNKAISIDFNNIEAKSELGRLLIEEKIIRNLPKGIEILENLKNNGKLPSSLNSILSKAHRQIGNIGIDNNFDLCSFKDPSPAVFREERKKFRALIRKYKKNKESEKLKLILFQFYNLAILVSICYGDHDCNSGVVNWQYEEAIQKVKKLCQKISFSYEENGYIEKNNFISRNDWKTYQAIFGKTTKSFNPTSILHNQD